MSKEVYNYTNILIFLKIILKIKNKASHQ